jgi:hypothetical protein
MNWKQQNIQTIATELLKQGWRVFISGNGEYMAFTDQ